MDRWKKSRPMSLNALEIYLLARELHEIFPGARIREVLKKGHDVHVRMDRPPHLLVSLDPSSLGVALVDRVEGEPIAAFVQHLRKRAIRGIRARAGDRLLAVHAGDRALVVELTGKHRNLFVLDASTRVLASLFPSRIRPGQPYTFPPPPDPDFRTLLQTQPGRLFRVAPYLERVPDPIAYVCDALRAPRPVLIEGPGHRFLAPLPVPLLPGERLIHFVTLSEAFLAVREAASLPRTEMTHPREKNLRARLEEELRRLARYDDYRRLGERILQEFPVPPSSAQEIREGEITVSIGPEDNPVEIAQELFARYRKMKRGYETLQKRLETLGRSGEGKTVRTGKGSDRPPLEVRRPYRVFLGPGGSRILVGRSREENHRLTFHLASPNAWWFHVKDLPGAHVVVPEPHPSSEDLLEAARIALWFSDGRATGDGEVWATRRRWLRSIPGKPGEVRILQGEVWRVRLPEGWEPTPSEG